MSICGEQIITSFQRQRRFAPKSGLTQYNNTRTRIILSVDYRSSVGYMLPTNWNNQTNMVPSPIGFE